LTTFSIGHPVVSDAEQQKNNEDLLTALNKLGQFISFGTGAPTHTPTGRAIYIRLDGGAGTTLYVYEGAGWAGK
jgi:hypothetical protein